MSPQSGPSAGSWQNPPETIAVQESGDETGSEQPSYEGQVQQQVEPGIPGGSQPQGSNDQATPGSHNLYLTSGQGRMTSDPPSVGSREDSQVDSEESSVSGNPLNVPIMFHHSRSTSSSEAEKMRSETIPKSHHFPRRTGSTETAPASDRPAPRVVEDGGRSRTPAGRTGGARMEHPPGLPRAGGGYHPGLYTASHNLRNPGQLNIQPSDGGRSRGEVASLSRSAGDEPTRPGSLDHGTTRTAGNDQAQPEGTRRGSSRSAGNDQAHPGGLGRGSSRSAGNDQAQPEGTGRGASQSVPEASDDQAEHGSLDGSHSSDLNLQSDVPDAPPSQDTSMHTMIIERSVSNRGEDFRGLQPQSNNSNPDDG